MATKGIKKHQRKTSNPQGLLPDLDMAAGNHEGGAIPRWFKVADNASNTKTETMPFQKREKKSKPKAPPGDRLLTPNTKPSGSRRSQVPSGGRLKSTSS